MKCNQCGFEREETFPYCPQCGAAQEVMAVSPNPAAQKVLQALKDPLFLVICILMSAFCLLSLSNDGLPLIEILITVFLWLVYAQSRKDVADVKSLRNISGVVFAQYVLTFVAAGLVLLAGVIIAAAFNVITADPAYLHEILSEFIGLDDSIATLAATVGALSGGILMVLFAAAGIIATVINIFSLRYIHGFAKSVYQSIENGVWELKYAHTASIWLHVFGALSGVMAISVLTEELIAGLSCGVICAACIIAGLLIRRYMIEK